MTEQKNRPLPPALYPGKVILASGSPRRQELLGLIVPEFEIAPRREVTEKCDPMTPSLKVPIALSQLKSKVYSDLLDADTLLITADTLVIVEGEILGKPSNDTREEAVAALRTPEIQRFKDAWVAALN